MIKYLWATFMIAKVEYLTKRLWKEKAIWDWISDFWWLRIKKTYLCLLHSSTFLQVISEQVKIFKLKFMTRIVNKYILNSLFENENFWKCINSCSLRSVSVEGFKISFRNYIQIWIFDEYKWRMITLYIMMLVYVAPVFHTFFKIIIGI